MTGIEVLVPLVFFLLIGAIWGSFILTRHKERMTMLDKGLSPEDIKQLYERSAGRVNTLGSLKWGIVFVAIGLAVIVGMWLREVTTVEEGVYPALIALFGGAGLIVFYTVARKRSALNP
jgi:hypothetical protein